VSELELDRALEQVVLGLERHDRREPEVAGPEHRLLQLPADEVADPRVVDLARTDGIVEEPEHFLERGQRVPGMRLVQVDHLHAESSEAGV
jgi:hypothetical protein